MTTDLEDLVQDTLNGRAATVTSGPGWTQPVQARRARAWMLPAAAAAAVVLAVAGGAVALKGDGNHPSQAGGALPRTCAAPLPRAWQDALTGPALTVDGREAFPLAVATDGTMITGATDVLRTFYADAVIPGHGERHLVRLAYVEKRFVVQADTDGRHAVLNLAPRVPDSGPDRPVDDIEVIDLREGTTRHLLAAAPVPVGYVVGSRGAVLQGGVVYWAAQARGDTPARGLIVAYDIARHRYRILDHLTGVAGAVVRDPRGVVWPGGFVRAANVPVAVPPLPASPWGSAAIVRSDGSTYAWTAGGTSRVLRWTAGEVLHGVRLAASMPTGGSGRAQPYVVAVSGRFVLLTYANAVNPHSYLVDTRTRAVADLGSGFRGQSFGTTSHLVGAGINAKDIATSKLPGLHC